MDRPRQQRDMVYCHQCENEWYRDEHGLACPDCHSDFTEVVSITAHLISTSRTNGFAQIEADHDPREDQLPELAEGHPQYAFNDHNPWAGQHAPDPDEDDISNVQWERRGPGGISMTFTRAMSPNGGIRGHGQQPPGNPLAGNFATMLQGILGGRPMPTHGQQPAGFGGHGQPGFERPGSAPSVRPGENIPNTNVRMGGGPGFQWSIRTSYGNLNPRDANNPQQPPELFDQLNHMLAAMAGGQHGGGPGMQRGQGDPFGDMGPLGGIFGLMNPANMQHGDAVYSQEALDRIISQLMEQNASGHAPGPASNDAIAALPKKTITEDDLGSEGKADCSICMDEAKLGEQVTILPCHHWFHGDCVKAWLTEHDTCPHCRQGIMPKDAPPDTNRPRAPDEAPQHDRMWGQGEGTNENPWVVPDSPDQQRRRRQSNSAGPNTRTAADNQGLFDRMRNAFGGGN